VNAITITCSSQGKGTLQDFVSTEKLFCWTNNEPNSWVCLDLGPGKYLNITHYTLGYGSSGNACCPRNWLLQGSNVYSTSNNPNDPNWVTLKSHVNDSTLKSDHAIATWSIPSVNQNFRYFRIIQTGKNCFNSNGGADGWSDTFVVSGFELYGAMYDNPSSSPISAPPSPAPPSQAPSPAPTPTKTLECKFTKTLDQNGVVAKLGPSNIKVTASSIGKGSLQDFVSTEKVFCWTNNEPNSWFCVDLGPGNALCPTHYTLGYGSSGNACCPRNWLLQGSNSYNESKNVNDPNWVTIKTHSNDPTLKSDHAIATWPLTGITQSFRYFRVIQTGKNCFNANGGNDTWSDAFVTSGFEIYGTVYQS